jgi:hypothetical protein
MTTVLISVLAVLVVVLGFTTFNLMRKVEKQEDVLAGYLAYLDRLSRTIEISDKKLKELDRGGVFQADDEVGQIFKSIVQIQDILNEFNLRKFS